MCSVCSVVKKNGIATQSQDHLPDGVGLLHQFVDHFVHELPRELDSFVDRRRGHTPCLELLVKLYGVACGELVDPDPLGHELFQVGHHLLPNRNRGRFSDTAMRFSRSAGDLASQAASSWASADKNLVVLRKTWWYNLEGEQNGPIHRIDTAPPSRGAPGAYPNDLG